VTSREISEQHAADAFRQHEQLQMQQEAFVAECLAKPPSPTEQFISDLRSIHAVDPRQAVADLAHDERTEGYARRPFRTNPHD
jgi:hypothetical protein